MADAESQGRPSPTTLGESQVNLSDDLLNGAEAIAEFIFGDPRKRRQVYHLAQTGCIPVFKLGATLCARRSTLIAFIENKEIEATKEKG